MSEIPYPLESEICLPHIGDKGDFNEGSMFIMWTEVQSLANMIVWPMPSSRAITLRRARMRQLLHLLACLLCALARGDVDTEEGALVMVHVVS